ncbi:MAG: tripartite tricarboxylate transporter substrate binding protein [Pseudomonadota bacterium]
MRAHRARSAVRRLAVLGLGLGLGLWLAGTWGLAVAQEGPYPQKPLRFVVPLTAGGPTDTLARIVATPLALKLKQPILVDDRPGAGGNIAAEFVARSPADGYTLFVAGNGALAINPSIYRKIGYDPLKDFAPVAQLASAPYVLAVNAKVPVSTVRELIAYAKANPGKLNFGAVQGSGSHLAMELFARMAGVKMTLIPYKGAAPATNDLVAGQIDVSFASTPVVMPHVKAGRLKALGVTSRARIAQLPEVPTIAESGLPGYEATVWYGVAAPAGTPAAIVEQLSRQIAEVVHDKEVHERMLANDFDPGVTTPAQFGAYMKSEYDKWARVVKDAGVRAPDE